MSITPATNDPLVRASTPVIGGMRGVFARAPRLITVLQVLVILTALGYAVGFLLDVPCRSNGWIDPDRYEHLCYSDIPALFGIRGFAEGIFPYVQIPSSGTPLEYPVLTGLFMWVAARITHIVAPLLYSDDTTTAFFDVNVVMLFPFAIITVIAVALTVRNRPWDGAMVALAPSMILGATINWDLIPVAATAVAVLAWSRDKPVWTGIWLGIAISAKFYPVVLLAAFFILAVRTKQWRPTLTMTGVTALTWILINAPFAIANFSGWWHFYSFNSQRGVDFGSPWYAVTEWGLPGVPAESINIVAAGSFAILLVAIAIFSWKVKTTPSFVQVAFLVLAAFVITSKVYSPQYVLWLLPFAVLAHPRWRDFLIWQVGELVYFAGIWWFLAGYGREDVKTLEGGAYALATFIHIGVTIWYAALIMREMATGKTDVSTKPLIPDQRVKA